MYFDRVGTRHSSGTRGKLAVSLMLAVYYSCCRHMDV